MGGASGKALSSHGGKPLLYLPSWSTLQGPQEPAVVATLLAAAPAAAVLQPEHPETCLNTAWQVLDGGGNPALISLSQVHPAPLLPPLLCLSFSRNQFDKRT